MAMENSAASQPVTREVVITRIYDAPRDLVWKMWTVPTLMEHWWGPKDFTNPVCALDVRIGELMADGVVTVGGAERLRGSLTAEGALRLLPGAFHSDGFYIALIERIA